MKSRINSFVIASLVAIATLSQAHAQNRLSHVTVPFAFEDGTGHMSAGTYTVGISGGVLVLRGDALNQFVMYATRYDSGEMNKPGYLAFRKYGDRYFLAEYRSIDGAIVKIEESKKERSAARELAASHSDPGVVRLALLDDAAPESGN
jgi:hypothetical protein